MTIKTPFSTSKQLLEGKYRMEKIYLEIKKNL